MSDAVWKETNLRVGRVLKNKQPEMVRVFVSDDAPGLCVRVAQMVDTRYHGHTMPIYDGSQIYTINHGHALGPTFYGEKYAFTTARQCAALFDWTAYDGQNHGVPDAVIEQLIAAWKPQSDLSAKDYQAFLAAHKAEDDARFAADSAMLADMAGGGV